MTDSQSSNRTGRRAQRGVSLIEVLVVLVILVTGILTIIRLFPSGFFSIQSTGNAGLADSLGNAAIDLGVEAASSLPEAILPDNLANDDLLSAETNAAAYANYDPDNPNNLENARVVLNETVAVPSTSNGSSVYVVKYGPVVMPADPAATVAQLPSYFTVNSPNWSAQSGSSAPAAVVTSGTPTPIDIPQDTLVPGQERFLVDLVNQKIAVPYAPYTQTGSGASSSASSFDQRMVVVITGSDNLSYTQYLDVPAGTMRDSANLNAPQDSNNPQGYLPDTQTSYQGGWFSPTGAVSTGTPPTFDYPDSTTAVPHQALPAGVFWKSVALYRPYNGVTTPTAFGLDPYQFKLLAANFGTANPGSIGFNPKAATGSGTQARRALISYIVSSWSILREDHDIPALTGTGSTFVVRTTVPNLKLAGSANPDNTINPGIAGSNNSIIILDLDTGAIVAPVIPGVDPTNPDKPLNNEDLNGPGLNDPTVLNVSYALGRLTFGSDAFADNPNPNQMPLPAPGTGTAKAHRIRIFYAADLDWTVAVQKPAAYFQALTASNGTPVQNATGTTALGANQFAYDSADGFVYFARCNSGKTVEIDGTYTLGATTQSFSDTIAIDPILYAVGDAALRVNISDSTKFEHPVPAGATVTFSAVRGLSARSVVAWKERNQYKVHSVDAVLNRTP